MRKKAVLVLLVSLSLIGVFSFDFVSAEKFITPALTSISPELGTFFSALTSSYSLIKNTDSNLDYMISSSRDSIGKLDTQVSSLYDQSPEDARLMMMKSNLNQVNTILDATEKIQKAYTALNNIETNIIEINSEIDSFGINDQTFDSIDDSIDDLDSKLKMLIESSNSTNLVNIQNNLEELDELIVDSKQVHVYLSNSKNKSNNLNNVIAQISGNEIDEEDISELESAFNELDETVPETDETVPAQIDEIIASMNSDLDIMLEEDPSNADLIDMKINVYELDLLTSNFDDMYETPGEMDESMRNIDEILQNLNF